MQQPPAESWYGRQIMRDVVTHVCGKARHASRKSGGSVSPGIDWLLEADSALPVGVKFVPTRWLDIDRFPARPVFPSLRSLLISIGTQARNMLSHGGKLAVVTRWDFFSKIIAATGIEACVPEAAAAFLFSYRWTAGVSRRRPRLKLVHVLNISPLEIRVAVLANIYSTRPPSIEEFERRLEAKLASLRGQ